MKQGSGLGKQGDIFSLHLNQGAEEWALEIPLTKQRETSVGNNHPKQDSSYKELTEQRGKRPYKSWLHYVVNGPPRFRDVRVAENWAVALVCLQCSTIVALQQVTLK